MPLFSFYLPWKHLKTSGFVMFLAALQRNRSSHQRCSVRSKFYKIHRKTPVPESKACNFIEKETLAQVLSCEFCEISKNTFLHRTPLVAASERSQQHEIGQLKHRLMNDWKCFSYCLKKSRFWSSMLVVAVHLYCFKQFKVTLFLP